MTYIAPNQNGVATAGNSLAVTLPSQQVVGTAQSSPALNYEFLTGTTNGWFDALGYGWVSITATLSGVTAGVAQLECSNDATVASGTGMGMPLQDMSSSTSPNILTSINSTGTTIRHFEGPVRTRYIRVRVSTAYVGSIIVSATLKQSCPPMNYMLDSITTPLPAGSQTIGNVGLGSSTNQYGYLSLSGDTFTDLSSTVVTTTTNSTAFVLGNTPGAASFEVNVTAASGTSPTLDFIIQESWDGANYVDLFHVERITATGTYVIPTIRIMGMQIRYSMVVGGTSPSFTVTVTRLDKTGPGLVMRSYFDRINIVPNTVGSTTGSFCAIGATQMALSYAATTTGSSCTLGLQGSEDNVNFYSLQQVSTGGGAQLLVPFSGKWVRAIVNTAGTGQTFSYIHFLVLGIN